MQVWWGKEEVILSSNSDLRVVLWQTGYLFIMGRYGDVLYFFQHDTVTKIKSMCLWLIWMVNKNKSTWFSDSSPEQDGTREVFLLRLVILLNVIDNT